MKKSLFFIFLFYCLSPVSGQILNEIGIPDATVGRIELLRNQEDLELQKELNRMLGANKRYKSLIQSEKLAIGLVDLRELEQIKFAQINGEKMMYAASLPKIAVLLAAMDALEKGELKESPEVLKDMRIMMSKSNNQATTRMIDLLGFKKIEQVLTDPQYELYDKDYGGGIWVGKRYGAGGGRYPDPLEGLSHGATATQVCRFYYLMLHGKLVCEDRSNQMLRLMMDSGIHHKFVNSLDEIAPKAKVFRKSGSWKNFHSDSVLVWGPKRRYILVALAEDSSGEKLMRQLVREVDKLLRI